MNKAGFLPSTGVMLSLDLKRYYEPLRLPFRAAVLSFPYTQQSMVSPPPETGLQHWAIELPIHADPATPTVRRDGFHSPHHRTTAFPIQTRGQQPHLVYEATSRFTCVTACIFVV